MPKRRNITQHTKPSSLAHPSLSTSVKEDGAHSLIPPSSSGKSVNEKLRQLRLEQNSMQRPPLHITAHPSIPEILQTPQHPPLRPRPGLRVTGGRRGPAGPPPPRSWLWKRSNVQDPIERLVRSHIKTELESFPRTDLPKTGTLFDQTFRALARNWDEHAHYDQYYLAALPVAHKETLLHYIALYSQHGIDMAGLEVLFLDAEKLEDATGAEGLAHLDLSTSVGHPLTFKDLKRFFTPKATRARKNLAELPESWEALSPIVPLSYQPRFHDLTHLSLSHPSSSATWKDLLDFAPHLASLTHLSLAHWPKPSLTPNSSTAFISTPSGGVSYGASNLYSEYDNDWSEAASILRRLSKHTLCLQWLDLTGCYPWIQCLSYREIPWCGAWADLSTIKIGQGHLPSCLRQNHGAGLTGNGRCFPDAARNPSSSEPHTSSDEKGLTPEEIDELVGWAAQEKRLQWFEKDVRARIKATLDEARTGRAQEREESASSDQWTQTQHHIIPKTGARTSRLEFDYGWRDRRIYEAIELAKRHDSFAARLAGRVYIPPPGCQRRPSQVAT
ncbi:MAG: hypothetical protein Q9217_002724 [Psora testacea]